MNYKTILLCLAALSLAACNNKPEENKNPTNDSNSEIQADTNSDAETDIDQFECIDDDQCTDNMICLDNTCQYPIVCGNGIKQADEDCDDGNTDSWDGCSSTCKKEQGKAITLMNWNILFGNYQFTSSAYKDGTTLTYTRDFSPAGGAAPTPPRAQALDDAISSLENKPAIINVMEMDPSWKLPENFEHFAKHGYKMLYPNTPFMLTQLVYQEERLQLIKKGYVNLTSRWDGFGPVMKTSVAYGVFQERETNEIFIALSTHWDPNDGVSMVNGFKGALDALYYNEMDRVAEAVDSINLVNRLRQEFPTAHIFYGGDFNTIDFELALSAIQEIFAEFADPTLKLADYFTLLGSSYKIDDTFIGSLATFARDSGLVYSRRYAIDNNLADSDIATVDDVESIKDYIGKELKTPIIIDYNFYSPEMGLKSYMVMHDGPWDMVSDHRAVKLDLEYYPRGQEALEPISYPDDSGTDLWLPKPDYQAPVFKLD